MTNAPALIAFFVEGEPRPKQSFRVAGHGRGFTPARVKAWQTDVACEAQRAMREIGRFNEPFDMRLLVVRLIFFLGDHRRVDLDNLSKAVLDGLNGICYDDDRQIVELKLKKTVVSDKNQRLGVNVFVHAYQEKEG
ncbi:MAG TPA: hypothetical protein DCS05_08010 [Nitrospiraceae bacterium]|nr:hypothetical protein [Nitrospiraceae bacterium]